MVELSADRLSDEVFGRVVVQRQSLSVVEGGSVVIDASHLDISPLEHAVSHLVPPTTAKNLQLFYVVRETPVSGVLQVTLTTFTQRRFYEKIFGEPGPSSFGRQQRLTEITIEPITSNMWKS